MTRSSTAFVAGLAVSLLLATGAAADPAASEPQPVIADIVVEGGVTLTVDTMAYYLGLEPGDPLDPALVAAGFHRLWDSGLVEDARVEVEEVGDGTVKLVVVVEERPFVTSVVFEGNDKVSASDIKDKLDERGIELPRNVPLRMASLTQIETALKEVYDAEGYRSADISFRVEETAANKRRVVYTIDEGGKVKIKDIDFAGNEVFPDWRLRHELKETKALRFFRFAGKKIIYSKESWDADRDNLRKFYLDNGYKDVKVGQPTVELVAEKPDAETLKKKKYRLKITVPVEEGLPYTLGDLTIKGVTVLNTEGLRAAFEIKPGDVYSFKLVDAGMTAIRDLYQNSGYIYAYTNEVLTDREGADHVVDVVIDVFEGDRYRLGRLEFSGNTSTHDKVLRREFRVVEGNWMNMGMFKSSVFKVNALGYWKLEEEPLEFAFDEDNKKVDVTVKGTEVGRNDLQFGAGYSELDGFFGQVMFNTRNFMGRGEILGVSAQLGGRADYYSLSFTEPYLFDRRILLGASIYRNNQDVPDYYSERTGASITTGLGISTFGSVSALLSFEDVYSRFAVTQLGLPGDLDDPPSPPLDIPGLVLDPTERTYEIFEGKTRSLTPAYNSDSRDDPFDPNRGKRMSFRLRLAGGPMGGDFDYVKPEATYTMFISLNKKSVVAFNVELGQFFPYNDSDLPVYERYRLGGDRTLRGLAYYTVRPRKEDGTYYRTEGGSIEGGDRYWLFNLEYQFRIGGPVKLVLFTDLGNTYHEDQGWVLDQYRHTAGVEMRIFLPIFQAPIRFIYGYNLDPYPDEDSSDFQFSIGTTF